MKKLTRILSDEGGYVLIESSLAFLILMGIFMGMIFYTVAYREATVLNFAVKEGARAYQVSGGSIALTKAAINRELRAGLMTGNINLQVTGEGIRATKNTGFRIPFLNRTIIRLQATHKFHTELEPRYYGKDW